MLGRLAENFVTLFVVLDPIGSVPIFLNATARIEPADRHKVAITSVLVATGVLMLLSGRPVSVMTFAVQEGLITEVRSVTDPDRLAQMVLPWAV